MKWKYLPTVYILAIVTQFSKMLWSKEMFDIPQVISTKYSPVDRKIICYLGSWSVKEDNFDIEKDFDPQLCTHIVFAFATIDDQGKIQTEDEGNTLIHLCKKYFFKIQINTYHKILTYYFPFIDILRISKWY